MKNNNKWKRISSGILAVCLVVTLLLSNQSFGVFAEEDNERKVGNEEIEENTEEVSGFSDADTGEEDTQKSEELDMEEDVGFYAEEIFENDERTSGEENTVAVQSEENVDSQADTEISNLIDADIELLKWKAGEKNTVTVTVGDSSYSVSDDSSYQGAYTAVYNAMIQAATIVSSNGVTSETETTMTESENTSLTEIKNQNITTDTIWNISGNVSMTGTVTIESSGRLVILGNGTIVRNGCSTDSSINLVGKLCLQGSVVFKGGKDNCDARFLKVRGTNAEARAELYLTDDFKIQEIVVNDKNGVGIYGGNANVYMSGGTIGSDEITFTWDNNITTEYGIQTESYLAQQEQQNEYRYLKNVNSENGCIAKGTKVNSVPNGAGIYMYSSTFYMSGGNILGNKLLGMCAEQVDESGTNHDGKGSHGAGAYFSGCQVNITGGKFSGNQSSTTSDANKRYKQYAGAIQLDGIGTCNLSNVEVSYNYAQMWVGAIDVYPGSTLNVNEGTVLKYNCAMNNCGGIAVDGTDVKMNMNGGKIMHNYSGGLGGGIRCLGTLVMNGGEISYNKSKGNAAGLSVQTDYIRRGEAILNGGAIHHNNSMSNGGGMGIVTGYNEGKSGLTLNGTMVYSNTALNGGGFYIDAQDGIVDVELKSGRIYENRAENGGGVYINQNNGCTATLLMTSNEMIIEENSALHNGGGFYLNHNVKSTGSIAAEIQKGYVRNNTAEEDGGGVYLASGSFTIDGGIIDRNTATNGGGAYIADGKVRMFGGNIENNTVTQSGGGFYVSSDEKAADVVIRSGIISGNKAGDDDSASIQGDGGAIAVVSNNSANANQDHVIIGLREEHPQLNMETRAFETFKYQDSVDNNAEHTHGSCPTIKNNQATGNGGGIYMNSSASILDIYCLLEGNNTAIKDPSGGSIMSEGGKVNIGDIDEAGIGKNDADAKGNVFIQSPMLVKGGDVRICGNAENPCFAKAILVDIQKSTEGTSGTFKDERLKKINDNDKNYVIEYFENFEESGAYKSLQYDEDTKIYADGSLYSHVGYKILGWATEKDATIPTYKSGELIGSRDDGYAAWKNIGATGALQLYAIWQRISYTVEYSAGEDITDYTGEMCSQTFEYGVLTDSNGKKISLRPNTYKVKGKRFVNWKTEDGTVIEDLYDKNDLTQTDGATVKLYAQWKDCTHDPKQEGNGHLSYKLTNENTITETCDCGGYTASVTISGEDVYYDEQSHPAILRYSTSNFSGASPTIKYYYKADEQMKDYGQMPDDETVPTKQGYYKASVTIGECTASVTYQIKSPAEAATIDVTAQEGQHFDAISGGASCTVTQDDAFTVRFNVQGLNKGTNEGASGKAYSKAPVLTLSKELPSGTTIIMQTENSYWYDNNPSGTTIKLNNFKKMGGEEQYAYTTENISDAQEYRFIIDFPDVNTANYLTNQQTLTVGLKYECSYSDTTNNLDGNADKEGKATISINPGSTFAISASENVCTVTAPLGMADTRWAQKNLVWMVTARDSSKKLPEDAKLTMTTEENGEVRTVTCLLNKDGKFIIPFTWENGQKCSFSLNTLQEGNEGTTYSLTATLCVGSMISKNVQPVAIEDQLQKASSEISLTVPTSETPALKIGGTQRVLSKSDTLHINITYKNIGTKDSVRAIIQKKTENGYEGNFSEKEISQTGDCDFSMQTTQGFGNYRVWVTVSNANGQTLLEVPYYFIVQE